MITLYPDQQQFVADLRAAFQKYTSVLGVAATGFGKTITSAYIASSAAAKGNTVWFTVHRRNLMDQTSKSFYDCGIKHGQVASGRRQSRELVQIASVQTLVRRLNDSNLKAPDLLVVDEAHLAASATQRTVIDWCRARGSRVLGNSGSPHRLDGKPLGDLFEVMVEGPPIEWLIQNNRLSDYELYCPENIPDVSKIRTTAQADVLMSRSIIIGDAIAEWIRHAAGKRTLVYCVSIKHSKLVRDAFVAAGIPAAHFDGCTKDAERKKIVNDLADGKIKVLTNCELATTGFDLSSQVGREVPIECIVLLRPTQSLALYLQMVGRGLRRKPYPAIILDHAGCSIGKRGHGLPCESRDWSLYADAPKPVDTFKRDPTTQIRQCGKCFRVLKVGASCPNADPDCPLVNAAGKVPEIVDGNLTKIDLAAERQQKEAERRRKKLEQSQCRTLEDLIALGERRGYSHPRFWAKKIWDTRRQKGRI